MGIPKTEHFPKGTDKEGLAATCKQRMDSGVAESCEVKKLPDGSFKVTTVWKDPPKKGGQ
jgi:hypothetical protein